MGRGRFREMGDGEWEVASGVLLHDAYYVFKLHELRMGLLLRYFLNF